MSHLSSLIAPDIDFGKRLTDALKASDFPYKGVFWLYDDEADDWQLVVATDLVDSIGPRATYLRLGEITKGIPASDFQLMRVSVKSPQSPVYSALHAVFAPAANVEGERLHYSNVNGHTIPDAYLYEIH